MTTKITEKNISNIANAAVQWQSVVVADGSTGLTAVAGRGYFIDTTSGTQTVTFPASPTAGDTIVIVDYATTFATNNVTINLNGNKLEASTTNATLSTNDQTHTFVFTDATQGWKIVNQDTGSSIQPTFISATGGTITTSGNFKIHSFTGDGCFVVSSLGNPSGGGSVVDYLVVAGGAGGGATGSAHSGGGGGAGGFREGRNTIPHYTASPLVAPVGLTVSVTSFPVTVGGGGAGGSNFTRGVSGSNSVFSTITSAGGGGGGGIGTPGTHPCRSGASGGSGGGGSSQQAGTGGSGNTPPTNPPQGSGGSGGTDAPPNLISGGGGGATSIGTAGAPVAIQGVGGNGATTSITDSPVIYSGGGGAGGVTTGGPGAGGAGGPGGGGAGGTISPSPRIGVAGTNNTGGGGGGAAAAPTNIDAAGGAGGKGIVVIRYQFQ